MHTQNAHGGLVFRWICPSWRSGSRALSAREIDVLKLMGQSNKEIGSALLLAKAQ
jgi:ATP/maltotriose-dependent transcriptional regulator MalT